MWSTTDEGSESCAEDSSGSVGHPFPRFGDGSFGHCCECSGRVSVRTPSRRSIGETEFGVRGSCADSESQTMRYVPRKGSREVVYNKFCTASAVFTTE